MRLDAAGAWHFVNGRWAVGSDGVFQPDPGQSDNGLGLQGYRFAFCTTASFDDLKARFRIRHNAAHSDVGLVLRAASPADFLVLHFPDCGQASRAENFWAALSRMDRSGVLRIIRLALVRRVASHPRGRWHDVQAELRGDHIAVRVDRGVFEVSGIGRPRIGRVGLMSFGQAQIHDVRLTGKGASADAQWREGRRRPHWLHPWPEVTFGRWQRPTDLIRLPSGQLLLHYGEQAEAYTGSVLSLISRSPDGGRSWAQPERFELDAQAGPWSPPRLHLTPAGRLVAVLPGEGGYRVCESPDEGFHWSSPSPLHIEPGGAGPPLHLGPQAFLNLSDGAMLMFRYGVHAHEAGANVNTWGAVHSQAFVSRSADDGKTWSAPQQLDDRGLDGAGAPIACNLDLTEVCAAEVRPGRVLALMRPIYSPWMWECWSDDGGRTWGPAVRGPFPGYACPNMIRTRSGALLVAHRLPGLTINCSRDGGENWDAGTMIDSGIWAMGAMAEVAPDLVLYVYWDAFGSLMRAQLLRVTRTKLAPEDMGRPRKQHRR